MPYTGTFVDFIKTIGERFRDKVVQMDFYVQTYSVNLTVPIERYVNSIAIKNAGTTTLTVEGDPLNPGDTKSIGGHPYAVLRKKHFNIVFTGAGTNLAIVTQAFFVDIDVL